MTKILPTIGNKIVADRGVLRPSQVAQVLLMHEIYKREQLIFPKKIAIKVKLGMLIK